MLAKSSAQEEYLSRYDAVARSPRPTSVLARATRRGTASCTYPTSQSGSPEATAMEAEGPSPLAGPHRALDGVGQFADPGDFRALRAVGKRFTAHSRLPDALKRAFLQRWAAKATSNSPYLRVEAAWAVAHCLGVEAEDFLTEILKGDKLQSVRAASARWLARIARRAAPATKKRIFATACARYDAEQGCMNVLEAIESSFLDVYQSRAELERQHPNGEALVAFLAVPIAVRELRDVLEAMEVEVLWAFRNGEPRIDRTVLAMQQSIRDVIQTGAPRPVLYQIRN